MARVIHLENYKSMSSDEIKSYKRALRIVDGKRRVAQVVSRNLESKFTGIKDLLEIILGEKEDNRYPFFRDCKREVEFVEQVGAGDLRKYLAETRSICQKIRIERERAMREDMDYANALRIIEKYEGRYNKHHSEDSLLTTNNQSKI